jgi:TonB-linked SusC/RagA family outer membrane protein
MNFVLFFCCLKVNYFKKSQYFSGHVLSQEGFFNKNLDNNMRKKLLWCLFVAFFSFKAAIAQNTTVTGKVSDDKGTPVEGALITEKGSQKNKTLTDVNGVYKISVKGGATLQVSSVGFEKKEATAQAVTNFTLKNLSQELGEVVVTALGIKREKKALGYAVSSVGKEELEMRPEADVARILSGKAPGLNILNTSGLSGSGTNINIRGISTITGGSQPLFIVDGVPFDAGTNTNSNFTFGTQTPSRFLDLDPNTIENLNVLKGLSATTLYGEAGRNGVILITTKNGSTQKTKKKTEVTVSQSVFTTEPILPEYNKEWGGGFDLSVGIAFFSNWGGRMQNQVVKHPYDRAVWNVEYPNLKGAPYYYKYYNSVPEFFRKGSMHNTSLNLAGNSGNSSYNVSYSYTDDQGFVIGNGLTKNVFGMGGTSKLTNKITVSGTINFAMTNQVSPPTSDSYGNNASNASVFGNVMFTPTAVDLMGMPYELPSNHSSIYYRNGNDIQNPRWTLYNSFTGDRTNRTYGQVSARYELAKGLNLTYRTGFDSYSEYNFYQQNKGGTYQALGIMRTSNGTSMIWDHSAILNYDKRLNENFTLTVDAGVNSRRKSYEQTGMKSTEQLVYGLFTHGNFVSHTTGGEDGTELNYKNQNLSMGAFAQANIGYKDYAYLTVGGRNSWASTVESANRSIFYPSVSLSYIPTSVIEALRNNKYINYLKLRVGYSTSANFPDPYSTRSALVIGTKAFTTNGGTNVNFNALSNFLPNPNLKPELLNEKELGIEGKFLNSRLTMDLTFYQKIANDQILRRDLDPSTGFTATQINAGNVENKGIELALGYDVIKNKNWKWNTNFLYTLNRSMVSGIPDDIAQINISGYSNLGTFAKNGQPYGVIIGSYFERAADGQRLVGPDGNYIAANDIKVIGDPNALYKVTSINTLSYKAFSFKMQWDYSVGGEMFSGTSAALLGRGVTADTQFDRFLPLILPGVLENGKPNNIQISSSQAYYGNSITNGAPYESAIYDATFIKLREASLAYSIPASMLSKTPFGSLSLSLSGTNLWYFAPNMPKYVHFDPEASSTGVGNGRGFEAMSGPSARRYGASIRVTF